MVGVVSGLLIDEQDLVAQDLSSGLAATPGKHTLAVRLILHNPAPSNCPHEDIGDAIADAIIGIIFKQILYPETVMPIKVLSLVTEAGHTYVVKGKMENRSPVY